MYKSNCRDCGHDDHEGNWCSVAFCSYSMDGDPGSPDYCECDTYVPSENLEYLEWSYNRSLRV